MDAWRRMRMRVDGVNAVMIVVEMCGGGLVGRGMFWIWGSKDRSILLSLRMGAEVGCWWIRDWVRDGGLKTNGDKNSHNDCCDER